MGTRTRKKATKKQATRKKATTSKKATARKKATAGKKATKKPARKPAPKPPARRHAAGAPKTKVKPKKRGKPLPSLEVDPDVLEFIEAIQRFKKDHARPFPTWSEILHILRELGYRKR